MALISIQNIELAYGAAPLLDGVSLTVERGERIALIGRNGSGKSTFLKLIEGSVVPDSGVVAIQKGIRIGYLSQAVPQGVPETVYDVVYGGLKEKQLSDHPDALEKRQQVNKVISQLGLDAQLVFSSLSAGRKRQVLLARALVGEPDVLLLDEPTNHMDIDSIRRLEDLLLKFQGALIFVTHDRVFLQNIANRIVEIDRGKTFDQAGDYETFLKRREASLSTEQIQNALFDKKLEKEEQWVRKGVRARRTRNEGRVRDLQKLRAARSARRERSGTVKMAVHEAERSGMLVAKATDISYNYGGKPIISNLSTSIMKGDRIGILGPNGAGKTTLLKVLLGELNPAAGVVRLGTNLQISYFDQLREQLDETKTVMENVAGGKDTVTINGKSRHILGYLSDFLFEPDQARSLISTLSGGERNRLLLAKLFTRPFNVLVLDEPTNDLDYETLEILEDLLMNFSGTVLLVSHDRAFINNVVTSTLVFEGNGVIKEYVGGYDDWLRQRQPEIEIDSAVERKNTLKIQVVRSKSKFGFKEKRELESTPKLIEKLETEQAELFRALGGPEIYKKDRLEIATKSARLDEVKNELVKAYARWEELEQNRSGV